MSKSIAQPLALLTGSALADKKQLAAFQENTAEQLAIISRAESLNVKRRLYVGIALHCIKASLAHGEFMPWLKKHAQGASQRQCNYMMKAAIVFIAESGIAAPEIKALPVGDAQLVVKDAAGRRVDAAADKFIGEMSWGELLAEYDIKDAAKLGGARANGSAAEAKINPAELAALKRDEASDAVSRARQLFVAENIFQFLKPDEIRATVSALEALVTDVRAAVKPLLKKS
jgi:hypothetical protein